MEVVPTVHREPPGRHGEIQASSVQGSRLGSHGCRRFDKLTVDQHQILRVPLCTPDDLPSRSSASIKELHLEAFFDKLTVDQLQISRVILCNLTISLQDALHRSKNFIKMKENKRAFITKHLALEQSTTKLANTH